MTHNTNPDRRASGESRVAGFSPSSLFSPPQGESGRMRENQNAILPHLNSLSDNTLHQVRENRENSLQPYTCAGATRGNRKLGTVQRIPFSPESPSAGHATPAELLWTSFMNREDIYAIAYRLGLPPSKPVDGWRLAALRIAKSEAFMQAKPSSVPLHHGDWQRWRTMQESPRKMLDLLRKLIYGVRIWG